jgi:pimeloyl-ACP methyl ester carboxylesterase
VKYHGKRGQNQGFPSIVCVDEDLRILLANLLQSSSSTFSWGSFLSFFEIVEGAGHWVQMEKPKETTALILRFLQGL